MSGFMGYVYRNRAGLLTGLSVFAVGYGGVVLWKDNLIQGRRFELPEDPEESSRQKVFLVTGANSGIGKAIAHGLAKSKQNKVYMLCRDLEKCESARKQIVVQTQNKYVYCRPCDLASFKSIRNCAKDIEEERIDGLINNAGIMYAPRQITEDGFEVHWSVNHLGPYLLTRLLTEKLIGGRVLYMINLDYRSAKQGLLFDDLNLSKKYDKKYAFYQSQLANVLIIQKLAQELKGQSISVNAINPGNCKDTNIKRYMGVEKSWFAMIGSKLVMSFLEKKPEEGAYTALFMALDRSVTGITGKCFFNMSEMSFVDVPGTPEDAKRLMAIDDYWSGLKSKEEVLSQQKLPTPNDAKVKNETGS